jgi:hypothetical protein
MSQVSCGCLSFLNPSLDLAIDFVEGPTQFGVIKYFIRYDLGKSRAQESVECASTEQSSAPALPRDMITVGTRGSFDQAVQAQPTQVVSYLAWGHVVRGLPQERSSVASEDAVGKTSRHETKHQ